MMTKEQLLREARINCILENKLFEAREELAALKASIPQIKHDAIMGMVDYAKEVDILFWSDSDAIQYAKNVLAQEKDKSE